VLNFLRNKCRSFPGKTASLADRDECKQESLRALPQQAAASSIEIAYRGITSLAAVLKFTLRACEARLLLSHGSNVREIPSGIFQSRSS